MNNFALDKKSLSRLTQIALIFRGLLANSTGEQDIPYKPVILKSLTSKEAIDGFDKLTTGFADSAQNAEGGKQVGWGLPHRKKKLFDRLTIPRRVEGLVG
jgi:hypothetical protein